MFAKSVDLDNQDTNDPERAVCRQDPNFHDSHDATCHRRFSEPGRTLWICVNFRAPCGSHFSDVPPSVSSIKVVGTATSNKRFRVVP